MPEKLRIPERLYGITGMPLGHSLSPLIHNRAFELAGLPAAYMALEKSPYELPALMHCVRNLPVHGLSVTIPHKQAVIEHLDFLTDIDFSAGFSPRSRDRRSRQGRFQGSGRPRGRKSACERQRRRKSRKAVFGIRSGVRSME